MSQGSRRVWCKEHLQAIYNLLFKIIIQSIGGNNVEKQEMQSVVRVTKGLIGGYVAISLGAILALILMSGRKDLATQEAWVHGIIVATTSLLMALFTRGFIAGKARAYLRLRITTIIMLIAIVITTAIPGDFPLWMKAEQAVCGLLLAGAVFILNGKRIRSTFSAK